MSIKYLIKFVEKEEYATYLQSGILYMNSLDYFARKENYCPKGNNGSDEIFDSQECYVGAGMSIGSSYACFCMYSISDEDCFENKLQINKKFLDKAEEIYKYFVVLRKDDVENALKKEDLPFIWDTVRYREIKNNIKIIGSRIKSALVDKNLNSIFEKGLKYSYQQEYRIVLLKHCESEFVPIKNEDIEGLKRLYYKPQNIEISSWQIPSQIGEVKNIKNGEIILNPDFAKEEY